jgi:hypothetical protein
MRLRHGGRDLSNGRDFRVNLEGRRSVNSYRCYCLNQSGRIEDVEFIQCDDEEEVPRRVNELLLRRVHFASIEAWHRDRMVVKLPQL